MSTTVAVPPPPTTTGGRTRTRLGKKEKLQLRQDVDATTATTLAAATSTSLPYFPLANSATATCPVVFSKDEHYCFISSGPAVKIHQVSTAQLVSTLSLPSQPQSSSSSLRRRANVTALLLNPSNPLQLIVGAQDGTVRLWDFHDGKLLRTLDLGAPVLHAAGHASLPDQLFVALAAPVDVDDKVTKKKGTDNTTTEDSNDSTDRAGIYSISLRPKALTDADAATPVLASTPRTPARRMRLAQPRIVRALSVSPSGAFLISLNPHTINICRTAHLQRGFAVHLDSPANESLTTLAFHPTENYFATGNERGQIRLWYDVLEDNDHDGETTSGGVVAATTAIKPKKSSASTTEVSKPSTALFHWHAHAVSSLAFTPNGAYLLSGGEEAVMVLWQLHTGHHEFVPRLGAPILTLTVQEGVNLAAEQQVAARLRDGTVVFVGSQKLKISKTISGIKADPVRQHDVSARTTSRVPLAVQPFTKSLVLPAGHPSSLQFYSPAEDAQLLELEVSPSNRVSSATDKPIEPTRVELVAFSTPSDVPGKQAGNYWMATVDTWQSGSFAPVRHLKFWQHRSGGNSFTLSTRIDNPHTSPITSLTFSPSSSSAPLLLTTSLDGLIKLWTLSPASTSTGTPSWRCRSSLSYRSFLPLSAAWSLDGSMFAVAHSRSVTLWSTAGCTLIHAFPCAGIAPIRMVQFVGDEGEGLLAGGEGGTMSWSLLDFEETFNISFSVHAIASKPHSSLFIGTERPVASTSTSAPSSNGTVGETTAFIVDPSLPLPSSAVQTRTLPFPVRQSLWIDPSTASTSTSDVSDVSLAVVNDRGEVSLVGAAASVGSRILPSKIPRGGVAGGKGQSRLFDEIFGAEGEERPVRPTPASNLTALSKGKGKTTGASNGLEVLDSPAHVLPPVKLLWREMLGGFKVTAPAVAADVVEEDIVGGEKVVDEAAKVEHKEIKFAPSKEDELSAVFKERLILGAAPATPGSTSGTPKGKSGGKK